MHEWEVALSPEGRFKAYAYCTRCNVRTDLYPLPTSECPGIRYPGRPHWLFADGHVEEERSNLRNWYED